MHAGRVRVGAAVAAVAVLAAAPSASTLPRQVLDELPILFQTDRNGSSDIFAMGATGRNQTPVVVGPANEEDAAWAPGGLDFTFVSDRDGTWQIYLRTARGEIQQLTKGKFSNVDPVWSRDGARVAFESNRNGNWDIYVMNADGSGQENLSKSISDEFDPAWDPSGKRVAFSRVVKQRADLYAATVPRGTISRLTSSPEPEFEPAFSPRGTRIAFSRVVNRNSDIYVMTLADRATTRLTRAPTIDADPVWTSDERAVLFSSARLDGDLEVYLVTVSGKTLRNLSNRHNANDSEADWRPGTKLPSAIRMLEGVRRSQTHGPAFVCGAATSTYTKGPYRVLVGGGGEDRLCGGAGRDWLRGFGSADKESGRAGRDRLEGGSGADLFKAHDVENDRLYGGQVSVAADGFTVTGHSDGNLLDEAWTDKDLDVRSGIDKVNF
jgi:Tol biopolymer transport system component